MTGRVSGFRSLISRRAVLSAGAAIAASPALGAECPIGPPPHERGPRVWMDMDQVDPEVELILNSRF